MARQDAGRLSAWPVGCLIPDDALQSTHLPSPSLPLPLLSPRPDLKCYNDPRIAGEPCVPNAPEDSHEKCGPGLVCRDDTHKCDTPK